MTHSQLRIGVDIDNTIVCYDGVFTRIARERGLLEPDGKIGKLELRDRLRSTGREALWTEVQGEAYGIGMAEAEPFPGVLQFFASCADRGAHLFIVSGRTHQPQAGPRCDLHKGALDWLYRHGFVGDGRAAISKDHVFFEVTLASKVHRIGALNCSHFIDDLPALLAHEDWPERTKRIHFNPDGLMADYRFTQAESWPAIKRRLLGSVNDVSNFASEY